MRAWIVSAGRRISPFLEPASEALLADTTVGAAVRASLHKRGFEVLEASIDDELPAAPGPILVLMDSVFVSDKCLGDFLAAAVDVARDGGAARLALARTPAVDFLLPVSSVEVEPFDAHGPGAKPEKGFRAEGQATERAAYDCFFVDGIAAGRAGDHLQRWRREAVRVVVKKRELGLPLRLPILGDAQQTLTRIPVTSTLAAHVEHWVHILWLNQLAFGMRWMELVRGHKLWTLSRVLRAAPWRLPSLLASFVRRGRGVRIHPTAHVEASILGDGVVIGPRASVRNSILGAGVEVDDHATVLSSTLGAGAYVTPRTFVVWSAAYPQAVLSNYKLQVSLIGRGASLSTWAGFIDAKLQGTIDVMKDGVRHSTERSFLGSCLGHGAHVGAKVLLLPGREVPNGAFIAMHPDELVGAIPGDLPAGVPLVRDHGTLVPLSHLLDSKSAERS